MLRSRLERLRGADHAPRPYVAFAAVDRVHARRLYRAQNMIWLWLGFAAVLSLAAYLFRPALGPVFVTDAPLFDLVRTVLFGVGGVFISLGIWYVRRVIEVWGHIMFATGAIMSAIAETAAGLGWLNVVLVAGLALTSAFRVWYIVSWIGAGKIGAGLDVSPVRR